MSVDKYFNRSYNRRSYNCAALVCEVWQDETGKDITHNLQGFLTGRKERKAILSNLRLFRQLNKPVSPCVVLMQNQRSVPHVGIYLRGRVLHIKETGVEFQPLEVATIGFKKVRFYTC